MGSYFQARYTNGKLINNVANYGAKTNTELKMTRNGEYVDISLIIHDDIYPLFNSYHIEKIKHCIDNNYENGLSLIKLYNIKQEYELFGNNIFKFIVDEHLINTNQNKLYNDYIIKDNNNNLIELKKRLKYIIHTLIEVPFHITNGGKLLPSNWIGREFKNGFEFHREIDKLETRINSPPCTYLCTYGLEIVMNNNIFKYTKNVMNCIFHNQDTCKFSIEKLHDKSYKNSVYISLLNTNVVFNEQEIFSNDTNYISGSVSYYVSLLQKSIRRCNELYLIEAIENLVKIKPFNNPLMNYKLVNPTRQLFWRLFISIIEDIGMYKSCNYLDIFDLIIYCKIFQLYPYKQINKNILDKVIKLSKRLIKVLDYIDHFNYKKLHIDKSMQLFNLIKINRIHAGLFIAYNNEYGMKSDFEMINRLFSCKEIIDLDNIKYSKKQNIKNNIKSSDVKLISIDPHTNPNIMTELQNMYYTTEIKKSLNDYSSDIWNKSSCLNIRKHTLNVPNSSNELNDFRNNLLYVQYCLYCNDKKNIYNDNDIENETLKIIIKRQKKIDTLFEKKYDEMLNGKRKLIKSFLPLRKRIYEQILLSSNKNYFQYKNNKVYPILTNSSLKFKIKENIIDTTDDDYNDILNVYEKNKPDKVIITEDVRKKYNFETNEIFTNFDVIEQSVITNKYYEIKINNYWTNLLIDYLLNNYTHIETYIIYKSILKLNIPDDVIIHNDLLQYIPVNILQLLCTRIYGALTDKNGDTIALFSQIDRHGGSKGDAVDEYNEGFLVRIMDLLTILYPCFKYVGKYKYKIITPSIPFSIFKNTINEIMNTHNIVNKNPMKIKTKLWIHQERTKQFVIDGIQKYNQRGFGDASSVGSGKTLTALSILESLDYELHNYLILVPNNQLYMVWLDEIKKHLNNINIYSQTSNGVYEIVKKSKNSSSIYITTMGRNRDHPLNKSIAFVIIDECISVQNKNAKWTVQCYKDVVRSKYGVLMLSATFFKTRYDKLFYLLKMLNTDIIERNEYLDTILNTAINANIITSKRQWFIKTHNIDESDEFYLEYNKIKNSKLDTNTKYIELKKLINKINWIDIIIQKLTSLLKENHKIIYFSDSERELKLLKEKKHSKICFYPDISKDICCINIHKGSHGINNLIKYDTILSKPVTNDIEIQMKGRLDRGNNKHNKLYLIYLVISDTIMELDMVKKEIGNNFYKNHIEALAVLYDKYL